MTPVPITTGRRSLVRWAAGSVSLYTLALAAAGGIRLCAVLLVVRAISPAAFGAYATLWVVMFFVDGSADLGLGNSALRFAPECATANARRSLFGTMISARLAAAVLASLVAAVAAQSLSRWTTGSAGNAGALAWLALSRPFAMVFEGLMDELRARGAMGKASALVVVSALSIHGASVLFVVGAGLQLMGLVWARVLGEVLACGTALALCWRSISGRPRWSDLRRLMGFGWPFGATYLLGMLRGLDRPLVRALASLDRVAAYQFGMRIVGPVGLFNIALGKVFEPVVYHYSDSRATPGFVDLFLRAYVAVVATVAMAIALGGPEVVDFLAPRAYHEAIRALPALAFSTTCSGLVRIAGIGADLAKRTRMWVAATGVTVVVGLPLVAILVPKLGVAGAAIAWLVAIAASAVFAYRAARKLSGLVLPIWRALVIIVPGGLLATVAVWHPWPLAARCALLLGFGVVAWHLLGLRWQSLKALWFHEGDAQRAA